MLNYGCKLDRTGGRWSRGARWPKVVMRSAPRLGGLSLVGIDSIFGSRIFSCRFALISGPNTGEENEQ
jgi:hypothetical protein